MAVEVETRARMLDGRTRAIRLVVFGLFVGIWSINCASYSRKGTYGPAPAALTGFAVLHALLLIAAQLTLTKSLPRRGLRLLNDRYIYMEYAYVHLTQLAASSCAHLAPVNAASPPGVTLLFVLALFRSLLPTLLGERPMRTTTAPMPLAKPRRT
jgi:hypothetical protein